MNDYIFLITLVLVFCSLAIVTCVLLYCRKIEQKCNYYIAKSIREQDGLAKQLERTRIEKEMIERWLRLICRKSLNLPNSQRPLKRPLRKRKPITT